MIFKSYEIDKINIKKHSFVLFYGQNEGAKKREIEKLKRKINIEKVIKFDEKEILENDQIFYDEILSKSLFEEKKLITINRATDKLLKILEKISNKKIEDVNIIINELVGEKSKLRSFLKRKKTLHQLHFIQITLVFIKNSVYFLIIIKLSYHNLILIL